MRRKINRQLITIAILATVVTMALITLVFRQLLQQQIIEDLKSYTGLLIQADLYQNTDIYVTDFKSGNVRITWIDAEGNVLGDTDADQAYMESHAARPEVQEALRTGEGVDVRKSETLEDNTYYYAVRLSDGTVLRISEAAQSTWKLIFSALPGLLIALLVIQTILWVVLKKASGEERNLLRILFAFYKAASMACTISSTLTPFFFNSE